MELVSVLTIVLLYYIKSEVYSRLQQFWACCSRNIDIKVTVLAGRCNRCYKLVRPPPITLLSHHCSFAIKKQNKNLVHFHVSAHMHQIKSLICEIQSVISWQWNRKCTAAAAVTAQSPAARGKQRRSSAAVRPVIYRNSSGREHTQGGRPADPGCLFIKNSS